ncbi:pyridoxal phosphate-dependent aminotransferase [candidate division WOR-3 bacterium]|nr:pyridoxal phosphate-dependent aminotransferase [candidate division WOR-3 bacterium]
MFAKRVAHLRPTGAFEFLDKAKKLEAHPSQHGTGREGKSIIHLEIGAPDFDTPDNIKDAAIKSLKNGLTKYVQGAGIPELRETIATHIAKTRNISVSPDEVVVGPGASPIIFYLILALIEAGDEVIYPDPGFFTYEPVTIFAGGTPCPVHLIEEKGFSIDLEEIKANLSPRTKLLILNFPHNPTGGMILKEDLDALVDLVRDRDIWILSDEVYSQMLYEGDFCSIASYPGMKEKTIILDGFSKTYAMTGWRLGYGVMDKELAYKVASVLIQCNSCTTSFIQPAGVEAIKGPQGIVKERLEIYRKRRDIIVDGLNSIPKIRCVRPKGAFYAFPNIKELGISSRELALRLLYEAGVCCLPGTVFGKFAEGYIRFTYSNSESNIKEALNRIKKFISKEFT